MNDPISRRKQTYSEQLLQKMLGHPELITWVQTLAPATLKNLIDHIGLEDAGELISLITTKQLKHLFDADLWHSQKIGVDETFDGKRFALWLEVMLELGEDFVVRKLIELPQDLVMLAFHSHLLVLHMDELAMQLAYDNEESDLMEKALDGFLSYDFGEYQLLSKNQNSWDTILSILVALDKNHHDFLERMLEHLCYISSEYIDENGGLYQVLTSEDMLESDAAASREDRRANQGFISPSLATSFLQLARQTSLPEILALQEADPVTKTYFRHFQQTYQMVSQNQVKIKNSAHSKMSEFLLSEQSNSWLQFLQETGFEEDTNQPGLLEQTTGNKAGQTVQMNPFQQAIMNLSSQHPILYGQRLTELAYLTNVLLSGASFEGRNFRPQEATHAVMEICNLGLAWLLKEKQVAGPIKIFSSSEYFTDQQEIKTVIQQERADKLFRIGWHLLHQLNTAELDDFCDESTLVLLKKIK